MLISGTNNSIHSLSSNDKPHTTDNATGASFAESMAKAQASSVSGSTHSRANPEFSMDTNQGHLKINLDNYLSPSPQSGPVNLRDIPLLLPTAHNVDTLSKYSEAKFQNLLEQYNIPEPPTNIEFDSEGKLVLPSDYPYSAELKQAFAQHPDVENALRTTAALASHYAGMMESAAFHDEMLTARNQADQDRIIQKYAHLFDDDRPAAHIVLSFLEDGSMLVGSRNA